MKVNNPYLNNRIYILSKKWIEWYKSDLINKPYSLWEQIDKDILKKLLRIDNE